MTALSDAVALLIARHPAIITGFDLAAQTATLDDIAGEALDAADIDAAALALAAADVPTARLVLDVMVWRWVEARAALGFDFSADGGSFQRSQLFEQATAMRLAAEARAAAAGLAGFGMPEVGVDVFTF